MAKQSFVTGQVLTAAQMLSLQQTALLGGEASAKIASYTLVAADAGTAISMSNAGATTITVNTGLFAAGDIVTILNIGAGVCTISAGTATVATSGSLALAQNQGGVLRFTSASAAIFFQFATPASGDIEGVTAGTGISGGGTSGTVTITNSMATEITAKGDLIVGTGNAAFDNLVVGANGTVLTADSTISPTGLKWATPAGGLSTNSVLTAILETITLSATAPTGTINFDIKTQGILYYTSNATANFTLNFRGDGSTSLNSILATGNAITVSFVFPNDGSRTGSGGNYPYYPSAITVDGNSVTPKFLNGITFFGGSASAINVFTYTIIKTASATFTVLATQNAWA